MPSLFETAMDGPRMARTVFPKIYTKVGNFGVGIGNFYLWALVALLSSGLASSANARRAVPQGHGTAGSSSSWAAV